jgi:GGDEF domain-containing protein
MAAVPNRPEPSQTARRQRGWLLLATVAAAGLWTAWPEASALHAAATACVAAGWLAYGISARRRAAASADEVTVPPLVSRTDIIITGDRLLARLRQKDQPLSVAVVEVADIADVERLFGQPVAEGIMTRLARKLEALATSRGLAARTGQTQFALLLPGRSAEEALLALRTTFGEGGCLEDETRDELVLLPDLKIDAVGPEHASIEAVYDALCLSMMRIERAPLFAPTVPAWPDEHRAAIVQAQERRASLYAPTLPMTP